MRITAAAAVVAALLLTGCSHSNLTGLPACNGEPELAALPLDESSFSAILPLGSLGPVSHTFPTEHHYLVLPPDPDDEEKALVVPVYAMQDGWIVEVDSVEHQPAGFTDYDVTLGVCSQFSVQYGHMSALSPELLEALGSPDRCESYVVDNQTYKRCKYRAKVPVSAGQLIGRAGGNPGQMALDLGAKDYRYEQNQFVNQGRYRADASYAIYAVSPFAYLPADLRAQVDPKMGWWDGVSRRTAPPIYGEIAYDVAGTAMGNWFREGKPFFPEEPHLALAKDNVDPSVYAISAGSSLGALAGYVVRFTPQHTGTVNRAFEEISDSAVYCYPTEQDGTSTPVGRVLLRLDDATTLEAEFQEGRSCDQAPAFAEPRTFKR